MGDIKKIINYLKISEEGTKSISNPMISVDFDFSEETALFTEEYKTVTKIELSNESQYYKLSNDLTENQLYLQPQTNDKILYFISKEFNEGGSIITKYKSIPNYLSDGWIQLDSNTLTNVGITNNTNYYYDKYLERIIYVIFELNEVVVIPDYKKYHPDDIAAEDEEVCSFDYLDHQGYTKSFSDLFLRVLLENSIELYANESKRNIIVYKKPDGGKISILPKITKSFGDYFLKYNYVEKGIRFNSFMAERAVKLEFNYFGALLEFLNQTIFNYYDELDYFNSNNKAMFFEDYTSLVNHLLKKYRGKQKLEVLYYIPIFVFQKIKPKFLWDTLDEILEGMVTNLGLNVEDITIRILEGLSKNNENKDGFIKELLVSYDKKETRFSILYSKLNGENFKKFVNLIHGVWFNSNYKNPENKLYKNNESPFVVNYEAKKEFTFFYSNKNISWVNANLLKFEPDTSWWDEIASVLSPAIGEAVKQFTETEKSFYYHPFQPIAINNFDKQQTGVELASPLMPAFVLKAGEDKAFWDNVVTASEYAVDIITTFSGVGNIAKFRHLAKVASKANKLKFVSRTGKVVANAKAAARGAVGVIEISSGTVNALLKITDLRDEPWAKELSEFLLILELCSLGADLGEFLLKRARSSAKNALEYEDEIRTIAKKEGIEDVDGLLDELYEVAELDLMASRKIGNLGGKVTTERQIRQLRGLLKQKGVNLILEGDIKNALNQFKPIVINGNKFDNPNDLFRFMKDNDFVGGFNAETKQFILPRKLIDFEKKIYENPTEIVLFHEMKHLEHFEEVGEISYNKLDMLKKETYVWNKILAERGKWTKAELTDALEYINRIRTEPKYGYNLKPITIK